MSISEFKTRVNLIITFILKMNKETLPNGMKESIIKLYANSLDINLTNKMIDTIIKSSITHA
jgi:hypothetical protein